jgi:Flp pilus assembly protein CpaB
MENKVQWVCTEDSHVSWSMEEKNIHTKRKKILISIMAVICITGIEFFLFKGFSKDVNSAQESYAVLILNQDVRKGDLLVEESIHTEYMNVGENQDAYVLNSNLSYFTGMAFKLDLAKGSPLLKNAISNDDIDTHLTQKIPLGKRLFVLDTDLGPIENTLRMGDEVDIIATLDIPQFGKATETILKKVKIVGIGDSLSESQVQNHSHSISFYLTPEEVKIMSFMKKYGEFFVSLRNPHDASVADEASITLNTFLQNEKIQKIIQSDVFQIIQGAKN